MILWMIAVVGTHLVAFVLGIYAGYLVGIDYGFQRGVDELKDEILRQVSTGQSTLCAPTTVLVQGTNYESCTSGKA